MINDFKEKEIRDSGLIYKSTFEQIRKLYLIDREKGGELAISAIELVLTGDISSDDFYVNLILEDMKVINTKAIDKWEKKKETNRQTKIEKEKLKEVAEMLNKGYTQEKIAKQLGVSQSTVSRRISTINADYQDLINIPNIQEYSGILENYSNYSNYSSNVNVNDNVNVNVNEDVNVRFQNKTPNPAEPGSPAARAVVFDF